MFSMLLRFRAAWLPATLLLLGLPAMSGAQPAQLNMGGSTTTSSFYPYYTAVANAVTRRFPELNVTVVSAGGFAKNVQLMRSGSLQFGGISPDLIATAQADGFDRFRVLWWADQAVQNIMVRRSLEVTDVSQLGSLCFHPGMTGSASQRLMLAILEVLEIKPKLHLSDAKDAINAIKNGRCDGQVKSINNDRLDAATAELNLTTPMWPVGYSTEQVQRIKSALPWMTFHEVGAGLVEGAPAFTTHSNWVGFAATSDMDDETAYRIVRGMWEGIDDQRLALKALAGVSVPQRTLAVGVGPLHAGAVRYYRELGLDIPREMLPPEKVD